MAHPDRGRVPMHVTEEALAAAVCDPYRSSQPECEQARVHLQADVLSGAEGPADSTEHQTDGVEREAETRCDLSTVLVQPLGRHVQFDTTAIRIRDRQGCFEAEEGLILHPDLVGALDHDRGGGIGIAAHDALVADHVAVGMDRLMGTGDRRLGIEQRREHFVVDDDCVECSTAGLGIVGGHGSDRFADVADHRVGEHRLVVGDQAIGELAGHVGGGDDGFDAGDLPGAAHVDRADACRRVRRTQRGAPQAAVGRQIRRELEAPLHLGDAVGTAGRGADRAGA